MAIDTDQPMPPNCQFQDRLSSALLQAQASSHADVEGHASHHGGHVHTHGPGGAWTPDEHGHSHEHLEDAGMFC
jgi:urease accessory protein